MQEIKRKMFLKRSKNNSMWGQTIMLCLKTHVVKMFLRVIYALNWGHECNIHLVMHVEECFKTPIIKIVMSAVWMLLSFKSVILGNGGDSHFGMHIENCFKTYVQNLSCLNIV